jgi:flagellar protein FliO/FliZ
MNIYLLSANQNNLLQVIVLLILFVTVLIAAFFTTKMFGKFQLKKGSSKNIHQLESISAGPGKFIQLIQIGEEYILIGITKDKITFLKEINKDNIDLTKYDKKDMSQVAFSKHLEKFLNKK